MRIISEALIKLPARKPNSHKGQNGKVLVIGGSPEYVGAPALAGLAALRSGADSVVVAAPEKVAWAINSFSPDLVTKKLSGRFLSTKNFKEILPLLKTADCVILGCGVKERP